MRTLEEIKNIIDAEIKKDFSAQDILTTNMLEYREMRTQQIIDEDREMLKAWRESYDWLIKENPAEALQALKDQREYWQDPPVQDDPVPIRYAIETLISEIE